MEDCIFCKIANHQIPSQPLYEDEQIMAIRDINPRAPQHILILSKAHITSLAEADETMIPLFGKINWCAAKLARELGFAQSGFRLISNAGPDSGQEVPHLHYHVIGGRFLGLFTEE